MGADLDVKISDYENRIRNNQTKISTYETQIADLNLCIKEINNQISCVEEDYPNNLKFKAYALLDSLWYGERKNDYLEDIEVAYSSSIKSFINKLENTNENIKEELTSISNKIQDLKYENFCYNILKGNLELEKTAKNLIEEII